MYAGVGWSIHRHYYTCTPTIQLCYPRLSPWYNRTGWLGLKHQLTCLPKTNYSAIIMLCYYWALSPHSPYIKNRRKGKITLTNCQRVGLHTSYQFFVIKDNNNCNRNYHLSQKELLLNWIPFYFFPLHSPLPLQSNQSLYFIYVHNNVTLDPKQI